MSEFFLKSVYGELGDSKTEFVLKVAGGAMQFPDDPIGRQPSGCVYS